MAMLATMAIRLAVIWAMCTGIVWVSVRLVGRRLALADAASVALLGSVLSLGVVWLPFGPYIGVFLLWTVLLWLLCRLRPLRAAASSAVIQLLAFIAFRLI